VTRQPIHLTRRGELVCGALGAMLAIVVTPVSWIVFMAVAR
jgi:hypothetical protein